MALYEILQEIMEERDITVADVARLCDLPDSTVRGIVTRKQKSTALEVAYKLSDGLNVSLERLNGMPEKQEKTPPSRTEPSQGEDVTKEEMEAIDKLIAAGLIQEDVELTDADVEFLSHILSVVDMWLEQRRNR